MAWDSLRGVRGSFRRARGNLSGSRRASRLALAAALVAQACVPASRPVTGPAGAVDPGEYVAGWQQTGVASWYGEPFHGRRTASGEVYDMEEMTAAHQRIPFGTRIRVDNQDNGRTTELMVNDRGPFVGGRILDVSRAGARALGMIGPGTARVRITIVGVADAVEERGGCVFVQVASFEARSSAEARRREAERAGYGTLIERDGDLLRVLVGPVRDVEALRRVQAALGGFPRRCDEVGAGMRPARPQVGQARVNDRQPRRGGSPDVTRRALESSK